MIKYFILMLSMIIVIPQDVFSSEFKIRAREHFDTHQIQLSDSSTEAYSGLSNTINMWLEKPRDFSFGFAINPVIGSAETETNNAQLGKEIKMILFGLEGKYYHQAISKNLFTRAGIGFTRLQADKNYDGYNAYFGAGWEFDINGIGLAFEMAYRRSWLSQNIEVDSITPSIGVHFYQHL